MAGALFALSWECSGKALVVAHNLELTVGDDPCTELAVEAVGVGVGVAGAGAGAGAAVLVLVVAVAVAVVVLVAVAGAEGAVVAAAAAEEEGTMSIAKVAVDQILRAERMIDRWEESAYRIFQYEHHEFGKPYLAPFSAHHFLKQAAIPLLVVECFLEPQDGLDELHVLEMGRHWGWAVTPKQCGGGFGEMAVGDGRGTGEASFDDARGRHALSGESRRHRRRRRRRSHR